MTFHLLHAFSQPLPSGEVHVETWKQHVQQILLAEKEEEKSANTPPFDVKDVDIQTEDVKYIPTRRAIQQAIDRKIENYSLCGVPVDQNDKLDVLAVMEDAKDIPKYQDLVKKKAESSLWSMKQKDLFTKEKIRFRKQTNFVSALPDDRDCERYESVDPNEIVLTVALYHPVKNKKTQAYRVLGSQTLTALRDCLYCLSDHILEGPQHKSGFFFIEGTFYNDMRFPDNIDYSAKIIEWHAQRRRVMKEKGMSPDGENNELTNFGNTFGIQKNILSYPTLNSQRMELTTFSQLKLRVNTPYVYVHQGCCEHRLVFTEVRMLTEQDNQNKCLYPLHVFQCKIRRKKCKICEIYPAKYITFGDKLAPEDPYYYCEKCYDLFHYDKDGKILYSDFRVYPYYHE
jgi:snRNA-activating protein complex subunit 3